MANPPKPPLREMNDASDLRGFYMKAKSMSSTKNLKKNCIYSIAPTGSSPATKETSAEHSTNEEKNALNFVKYQMEHLANSHFLCSNRPTSAEEVSTAQARYTGGLPENVLLTTSMSLKVISRRMYAPVNWISLEPSKF